jgi:hypothetical protein
MSNPRPADDLDRQLDGLEQRLPPRAGRFLRWLRKPSSAWVRFPLALLLMVGGVIGFLPILGFWMLPLGLILIAQDIPPLRPPIARLIAWAERKWAGRQTPAKP